MVSVPVPLSPHVCEPSMNSPTEAALHGITRALASVGRAFVCLDPFFRILHASGLLDRFLGQEASAALRSRSVGVLRGDDLFGPRGAGQESLVLPSISRCGRTAGAVQ
jgi:hypothetical protein